MTDVETAAPIDTRPRREYLPILDVVRIIAVAGVVAIHVLADAVRQGVGGTPLAAVDMALIAAVPVFFMMSGALNLSPSAMRHGAPAFWTRRAVRIVPAVVVWSAFYILVIRRGVTGTEVTGTSLVDWVLTGLTYTHLYFLWAIAGLYVLAPLIWDVLRVDEHRRAWLLGLAGCAWTATVMAVPALTEGRLTPLELGTLTFPLAYAGYFIIGRAALIRPIPRAAALGALAVAAACVAGLTALLLGGRSADGEPSILRAVLAPSYVSPLTILYAIALYAAVLSLGRSWRVGPRAARVLRTLGDATFGVYLAHFAILVLLRELPWFAQTQAGPLVATWAISVAGSGLFALVAARIPGLRLVV